MKFLNIFLFFLVFVLLGKSFEYGDLDFLNRRIYSFNRGVDKTLLSPAISFYVDVIPSSADCKISDFVKNVSDFQNFFISVFELNFYLLKSCVSRVFINFDFGLFGFLDIASSANFVYFKLDFKDVLRFYGYNYSNYIVFPVIGPMTIRDVISLFFVQLFVPQFYFLRYLVLYYFFDVVFKRSKIFFDMEFFNSSAIDGYSFLKDIYLQNNNYDIDELDLYE